MGNFLLKLSSMVAASVTSFLKTYPFLSKTGHPTSWWNFRHGESSGLLKLHPRHNLSCRIIVEIRFQGTPLVVGILSGRKELWKVWDEVGVNQL